MLKITLAPDVAVFLDFETKFLGSFAFDSDDFRACNHCFPKFHLYAAVSAEVLKGAWLEANLQLICHFLFLELLLSNMSNAMGRVVAVVFLV